MKAWIPLRAMRLVYDDDQGGANTPRMSLGVCLPDGRFILLGHDGAAIITYSSEAMLVRFNPGARLEWCPHMDATINHVMDDDQDAP